MFPSRNTAAVLCGEGALASAGSRRPSVHDAAGEKLFLAFAAAFWLLAANQALVGLLEAPREDKVWIYLLRLAAFLLIIFAVVAKNLRRPDRNAGS